MLNWAGIGAAALAMAVMLGAFGAHVLRGRLDAYAMSIFERAVFYHFIHGFGLMLTPLLVRTGMLSTAAGVRVAGAFMVGILLFSGSLYALALTGVRVLGAVTPFGGIAFILAWIMLAVGLCRNASAGS